MCCFPYFSAPVRDKKDVKPCTLARSTPIKDTIGVRQWQRYEEAIKISNNLNIFKHKYLRDAVSRVRLSERKCKLVCNFPSIRAALGQKHR